MTNEELADIRAYVAERQAARARGEHIDSDERREAALLDALDEATRERAADFGVPQARKRVFIFGYLESAFPATAIDADEFFEQVQNCRAAFLDAKGLSPERPVSVEEAIDDLNGLKLVTCPDSPKFKAGTYKTPSSAYAQLMRMGVAANAIPDSHRFSEHNPATLAFYKKVHADGRFGRLPKEYLRAHGTKKDKKVLIDPRAPASTITTHPDEFIHYEHPRNVSVREMARLQSFPDLFRFRGRYTINGERRRLDVARCSQVGNAVPPFLGEVLGVALRAFSERLRGGLRALPVLRTCGDCGWLSSAMERSHPVCDHPDSRDKRTARGRDSAPASWCPQRGGER